MSQPKLTPRDGANIPSRENLSPDQKRLMEQVADLTKSENHAISVLVQAQEATLAAVEDCGDRLQTIIDLLVKALQNFGVPLPKSLEAAIIKGDYNPDELSEVGDDEEDEEDDEDDEEDEIKK
jgi:hypothetical protein